MEKQKILVIAPYGGMVQVFHSLENTVQEFILDIYLESDERIDQILNQRDELLGYAAILAQGRIYEILTKKTTVPVFEIMITYYDILAASRLSLNYDRKSILLAAANIVKKADSVFELLGFSIDTYPIHFDADIKSTIEELRGKGYTLFITDAATNKICRQVGVNSIMITSNYDSVVYSLQTAVSILQRNNQNSTVDGIYKEYAAYMDRSYTIFTVDEQLVQCVNVDNEYKLIHITKLLIPAVLQEKEIQRIKMIKSQSYFIKGSLIYYKGTNYVVFEIKKSLENSKTSIPGIIIKNNKNLSKDFYDVFYDDLCNLDFRQKVIAYSMSNDPVVILGESGTGKSRLAEFIYSNCIYHNNPLYLADCKQLDKQGLNYLFSSVNSPLYEYGITLYFKEINLLKKKYLNELIDFLKQSLFMQKNKMIFSVTCEKGESYDNKVFEMLTSKLNSFPLYLKPLRERLQDIPNLSVLYINKLNEEYNKHVVGFEPEAMNYLQSFSWNDNIKQFKRVLKELFITANTSYVSTQDVISILSEEKIGINNDNSPVDEDLEKLTLEEIINKGIRNAMIANNMNQTRAAKQLGISRTTLWRFLKK